ncbi:MAG: RsfS/YbeB/iojap family protein [Deltaproteobacteria bacterium]|nr:RsfS/YbeB/iojap family protein [Deltaproteobacteria bacterium]
MRALSTLSLEKKAENVVILDVERLVNYCDYFVICSGTNSRQVRAIAQHCMDMAESDLGVKSPLSGGVKLRPLDPRRFW